MHVQPVTTWLLYLLWEYQWDTRRRARLRRQDSASMGLDGKDARARLVKLWLAEKTVRGLFALYARVLGLAHHHLPDMDEIATISHPYYDNHLRGGEGHMEVGELLQSIERRKAHMVLSVKPFGCLPSSGVSDGVQTLVTARHPEAIFTPIETTGDAAVTAHSRIQMDLFKARRLAQREYAETLEAAGWSQSQAETELGRRGRAGALEYPAKMGIAGTAARLVSEMSG